ncbi:unnamed protein product [Clavelina lepadiformis]|uniref:Phosphatidylinositol transfer protein N-terminal domain-containing protein n=1 Tax=Clavelina lepadiformis TaxID=159417 RepID=A0ABP0G2Y0_CLALP
MPELRNEDRIAHLWNTAERSKLETGDIHCVPDLGESENVHNLPEDEWKNVEVVLVNDPIELRDYSQEYDLKLFKSAKTCRGA